MRGEQRRGGVEDVRPSLLELVQLAEARLDSVEGRAHVEAAEDEVSMPGAHEGCSGPEPLRLKRPAAKRLQQQGVRQRRPVGEDEEHCLLDDHDGLNLH